MHYSAAREEAQPLLCARGPDLHSLGGPLSAQSNAGAGRQVGFIEGRSVLGFARTERLIARRRLRNCRAILVVTRRNCVLPARFMCSMDQNEPYNF